MVEQLRCLPNCPHTRPGEVTTGSPIQNLVQLQFPQRILLSPAAIEAVHDCAMHGPNVALQLAMVGLYTDGNTISMDPWGYVAPPVMELRERTTTILLSSLFLEDWEYAPPFVDFQCRAALACVPNGCGEPLLTVDPHADLLVKHVFVVWTDAKYQEVSIPLIAELLDEGSAICTRHDYTYESNQEYDKEWRTIVRHLKKSR